MSVQFFFTSKIQSSYYFILGIRGQCRSAKDAKSFRRRITNISEGNILFAWFGRWFDLVRFDLGVCLLEAKTTKTQNNR